MRESKETYYEILGVSDIGTFKDIKKAYLERCKNYHPDALHPNTPEGARKLISERMTLINEAYGVLKDDNARRQYDKEIKATRHNSKAEPRDEEQKTSTYKKEETIDDLLGSSILEDALLQLELEEKQFDYQLKLNVSNIESKYSKHLRKIKKHTPGSTDILDSSMKLEKSIIYGVMAFIGLWLIPIGIFISFYGWGLLIVCGFLLIKNLTSPVYRPDYVKEVLDAKARRDIGLSKFKANIEGKVNYFKKVPIASINFYFIKELSSRDRLLLVKALKQREDTAKAEQSVQSTVKVVAAISLLAIFLGSIGG